MLPQGEYRLQLLLFFFFFNQKSTRFEVFKSKSVSVDFQAQSFKVSEESIAAIWYSDTLYKQHYIEVLEYSLLKMWSQKSIPVFWINKVQSLTNFHDLNYSAT